MRFVLGLVFFFLAYSQSLPQVKLFGEGKCKAFFKQAEKAYRKEARRKASTPLEALGPALSWALALTEQGAYEAADSILRMQEPLLSQNPEAELVFWFSWIRLRWAVSAGALTEVAPTLAQVRAQAQQPWQVALARLEEARYALRLEDAAAALAALDNLPPLAELNTPLRPFLLEERRFLRYLAFWQAGQWDSLPQKYPKPYAKEYSLRAQSEIFFRLAEGALLNGQTRLASKHAKKSLSAAKKLADAGGAFRARALLAYLAISTSSRGNYQHRLRGLSPLLVALRSADRPPLSIELVEGLNYLSEALFLLRRPLLAENAISFYIGGTTPTLSQMQLSALASQVALRQGRPTIAVNYATQAQNLANRLGLLDTTLLGAQTRAYYIQAVSAQYQYAEADTAFFKALRTLASLGEPAGPQTLPIRQALARYATTRGYYSQGENLLAYHIQALERLIQTPLQSLTYLRSGLLLADLRLRLLETQKADTLLSKLEPPIEGLPRLYVEEKIQLYELLGDLFQLKAQFREAEQMYLRALRLRSRYLKEKAASLEEGYSLLRLARLYQKTGRFSQARQVYQKISAIYEATGRKDPEAAVYYIELVQFYLLVGDYLKAQETAKKAIEVARVAYGESSPGYAEALLGQARVEEMLGRYESQRQYLLQALSLQARFYADKPSLALSQTHLRLAQVYLLTGRADSARVYAQRAVDVSERAQSQAPIEYASLSLDLANLYLALGELSLAEERIAAASAILEAQVSLRHPERIRSYLVRARLLKAKGEYLQALAEYKRFLSLWRALYKEKHPEYAFYLGEMADYYYLARDLSSTKKTYEKAAEQILAQVDRIFDGLSESDKVRFWGRARRILERYYAYAFGTGVPAIQERAYQTYLATKALILSESAQLRSRLERSRDTTVRNLYRAWKDQKEYLVRLYTYTEEDLRAMQINLSSEEARLNELERQLAVYIGDLKLSRPSWKVIRDKLPQEAAAIDWIRTWQGDSVIYYAVIITPKAKRLQVVAFPNGRRLESYYLFRYAQGILNFEKDTTSYQAFWAPVAAVLPPEVKTLIVSNDGIFHQVNLSTIALPEGGYLVDKYKVIYHSRLASLAKPPKPIRYYEGRKAWILADPDFNEGLSQDSAFVPNLPGTAEEGKAVQALLQASGVLSYLYTREAASELKARQTQSPYILHIATHGLFLPYDERLGEVLGIQSTSALENPLFRSALLLVSAGRTMIYGSSDPEGDGILNAYELLNLQLDNTEVVALSACETGLGEVQNGEGVYGLQRAFLIAGARNMLLSLWRVDDEATRDFMTTFYRQWLQVKLPVDEAFWQAQKAMRRGRPQPYFWGAFVLMRP